MVQEKLNITFKLMAIMGGIIAILFFGGDILLPFLFAVFTSLALYKFAKRLEGWGMNRLFSSLLSMLLFSIIFFGIFYFIAYEAYYLVNEINQMQEASLNEAIDNSIEQINDQVEEMSNGNIDSFQEFSDKIISGSKATLSKLLQVSSSTLSFLGLVPVYIFFILFYRNVVKRFLQRKYENHRKKEVFKTIYELIEVTRQYLKGMLLVILCVATLNALGLWIIGIKYAVLLGILSGILTIIPYVGVFVGAMLPVAMAYFTGESNTTIFLVIGMYVVVQFIEGNLITPNIMGKSVDLNPLAIIVGILVLGALCGMLGMILTIPILASTKVLLSRSEHFSEYAILLGNKSD